jgi:probable F420-dependent oxidoreductase
MDGDLGAIGVWRTIEGMTPAMAAELETLGYGALWVGGSPKGDLEDVERLIEATETIPVVTGIVNMWREPAEEVAASYLRIESRHAGRFILGVGIGHPEATAEYQHPLDKMDEYLTRLGAAGVPPARLVLAALGPKALRMAAERTAGAHPYLSTPRHTRYARGILGQGPLLAPEQKVVLGTDPDAARSVGREVVARYLGRVNYCNNLLREGWSPDDLIDGGSDALVDALALHGAPAQLAAGIRAHLEAGADHVSVQALGGDAMVVYRELAPLVFERP